MAGKTSFALTMIVYKSMYVTCGILVLILILILILVLPYRQDVVIVGAGRYSRSAKFATSSELLYLLNLLYNGLSGHIWHMTSDIPDGRRAAVRAYPMTILRYAASSRADGRARPSD